MDESSFESETLRPFGYAPIGKHFLDSYNWQAKKCTNVIGTLYEKVNHPDFVKKFFGAYLEVWYLN